MIKEIIQYFKKGNDNKDLSYKALRRLIGVMGILLPLICILGGCFIACIPIQQSISIYYYTNMRDFFVGLMFVVSFFLLTYKGYNRLDFFITLITGFAGLGVALFPCFNELYKTQRVGIFQLNIDVSDTIHLASAGSFFILLAINSIFLFTRKNHEEPTPEKGTRNIIYIVCGIIILISLTIIFICMQLLSDKQLFDSKIVLILEAIALLAFGTSWLIKGETLFTDKK
jgi:hypothetical protein